VVVVSLFVNPSQFNEHADLDRYPRQEHADVTLAADAGADLLFAPSAEEVYPPGFATSVEVFGITERLEGASRGAEHFRGVCTVVTKLLCMALPDIAYFGQKDAQQLLVIHRLVRDLNLPVQIEACPTVREPDGLAMSSRNALLGEREREQALALYGALRAVENYVARGERRATRLLEAGHQKLAAHGVHPEYLELVELDTLERLEWLDRPALLAVAAPVGAVRLIDNLMLEPTATELEPIATERSAAAASSHPTTPPSKETATCSA
jgi:pantoate--beta-alanine ligase